jgi:aspartate/methionine/tyrosine aminotransferase
VLADPELTDRMWHLADIYYGTPAHPAELLGIVALDNLEKVAERARTLLTANRAMLHEFLDSRRDLDVVRNQYATTVFPRVLKGSVDALDRLLREKYETSIVPGSYFGQAQHFRMGMGGDTEMTREGLQRLGNALDELS